MNPSCVKYNAGKTRIYKRYIQMCEKADDIQKIHYLAEGDCFYHSEEGINEASLIRNDRIKSTPDRAVDIPISECIWLPSEEQLIEMADEINLTQESLQNFLDDTTGTYGYIPCAKVFFRTSEDQWLAYYMFERYSKIWSIQQNEWTE